MQAPGPRVSQHLASVRTIFLRINLDVQIGDAGRGAEALEKMDSLGKDFFRSEPHQHHKLLVYIVPNLLIKLILFRLE
jgi:hypothetical protein